jgi:hypothetical protein
LYTETSSLKTLKVRPRNLNGSVRSWIRLQEWGWEKGRRRERWGEIKEKEWRQILRIGNKRKEGKKSEDGEEKECCRKARARESKQLLMMGREIRDDREKRTRNKRDYDRNSKEERKIVEGKVMKLGARIYKKR